jgi:RimJ/RimL family protein N-acetyltransferase
MGEFRLDAGRLILRSWRDGDIEPFAAMGRDAEVMRYLGRLATHAEAQAAIGRMVERRHSCGHCFRAVERKADGMFPGLSDPLRRHILYRIERPANA